MALEAGAGKDFLRQFLGFRSGVHGPHADALEKAPNRFGPGPFVGQDQVFHPHRHVAQAHFPLAEPGRAQVHFLPHPHLHHDALPVFLGAVVLVRLVEAVVVGLLFAQLEQPHDLAPKLRVLGQIVAVPGKRHVPSVPNDVHESVPPPHHVLVDWLQKQGRAMLPTHTPRALLAVQPHFPRLQLPRVPFPELGLAHVGELADGVRGLLHSARFQVLW